MKSTKTITTNIKFTEIKRDEEVLAQVERWVQMAGIENFGTACLSWTMNQWKDFYNRLKKGTKQ